MTGSSGISDHFNVRAKIKVRLLVKWLKKKALTKKIKIEPFKMSRLQNSTKRG